MPEPTPQQYLKALRSLTGILASVGVLVPALAYFTLLTPPLLEESSLLTAGIAVATLAAVFQYRSKAADRTARHGLPALSRKAVRLLVTAVACLFCYLVLLHNTTIVDPQGQQRWQIGFSKLQWSLTAAGRQKPQDQTVEDWMLSGAYFREGGPEVLWSPLSIDLAGGLLVVLFTTSFVLWTAGWGLMAKQEAYSALQRSRQRARPARRPVRTR